MSVLNNFEQWKDFLAERLHAGQQEGMDRDTITDVAHQIGDYLAEHVDPKNDEQRLLKELWDCSTEEEQQVLANIMVKFVKGEGNTH